MGCLTDITGTSTLLRSHSPRYSDSVTRHLQVDKDSLNTFLSSMACGELYISNQSGGFGGYGGNSRMSGSGQFMTDLGGTPGYSSSSLFMP